MGGLEFEDYDCEEPPPAWSGRLVVAYAALALGALLGCLLGGLW